MPRFISAPDVRDLAELFDAARHFLFVKTVLLKERFDSRNISVYVQHQRLKSAIRTDSSRGEIDIVPSGLDRGWNQARAGNKKRSFAFPIALLPGRPRDHIVGGGNNRIDRLNISRI